MNLARWMAGLCACGFLFTAYVLNSASDAQPIETIPSISPDSIPGFALVELFTSQGCSSCPPADRVLKDLVQDAEEKGIPVYGLAFHVDYWNYLGWKDPYSDKRFSNRQRSYGKAFGRSGVYTPQMVVNGHTEFVGSDRGKASLSIGKALRQQATAKVELQLEPIPNSSRLTVKYSVSDPTKRSVLNLAIVESGLNDQVARGENRGRKLEHVQVVRVFEQISLENGLSGETTLFIPPPIDRSHSQLIAYVQDVSSMLICGAERMVLP